MLQVVAAHFQGAPEAVSDSPMMPPNFERILLVEEAIVGWGYFGAPY